MKVLIKLLSGMLLLASAGLSAQQGIEGDWAGVLNVGPGTEMTVQFKISRAEDGSLTALLSSPDNAALKDMPASSVTLQGNDLTLVYADIQGEFKGVLADGSISGEWSQAGQRFSLVLAPPEGMSAENVAFLTGTWSGDLKIPGLDLPVVFHFEADEETVIAGKFDSPKEGAFGLPVSNITFDGAALKFNLAFAGVTVTGELAGDTFDATWAQAGQKLSLTLVKGESEYAPPVSKLDLDEATREALLGTWNGSLGPLQVNVRFEYDEDGDFAGYLDSLTQNVMGVPITSASLDGTALDFALIAPPATFEGELTGDSINGTWTQLGQNLQVNLTRIEDEDAGE